MQNSCDQSSKDSFFSFCFVEFLIGMQNDSIQGTSILVRLVSYMYDINNALNISALIFFFLNQPGMVVFTFFFVLSLQSSTFSAVGVFENQNQLLSHFSQYTTGLVKLLSNGCPMLANHQDYK